MFNDLRDTFRVIEWHLSKLPELKSAGNVDRLTIDDKVVMHPGEWVAIWNDYISINRVAKELFRMVYDEQRPWHEICFEMGIEKSTFYQWKREMITFIALVACCKGLIDIDENKSCQARSDVG